MTSRIRQFRRSFVALAAAATLTAFAAFSAPAQAETQLCPDINGCILTHITVTTTKSKDGTTSVSVSCTYACNSGDQFAKL